MPSNPTIRNIPRERLSQVFKDPDLVKLFEDILYGVGTTLPANIDTAASAATDAAGIADAAQATAISAQLNLNAHITDPADAHDASAVSNVPAGGISATDVQGALNELDGDLSAFIASLGTLSTQDAGAVAITGGAVDGTPIGATTPAAGKFTTVESAGYVKSASTVVASLPSAVTAGFGARMFVTDATAVTFLTVVTGGGTNKVPVVSDGANWVIG